MKTYNIPTGKSQNIVYLNGNLMTGQTFGVKEIIKRYFCGKWDATRKGWIVDLKQIAMFEGTKIKPVTPMPKQNDYNPARWYNRDGSLGEDF